MAVARRSALHLRTKPGLFFPFYHRRFLLLVLVLANLLIMKTGGVGSSFESGDDEVNLLVDSAGNLVLSAGSDIELHDAHIGARLVKLDAHMPPPNRVTSDAEERLELTAPIAVAGVDLEALQSPQSRAGDPQQLNDTLAALRQALGNVLPWAVGPKVLVLGGIASDYSQAVDVLDSAGTGWRRGLDLPANLSVYDQTSTILHQELYVVGIASSSGDSRMLAFTGRAWEERPRAPHKSGGCLTAFRGRLFYLGGADLSAFFFNGTHWNVAPSPSLVHRHACAVVFQDRLYLLGGEDATSRTNAVEVLDDQGWEIAPPMLTPRSAFAAVVYRSRLYVVGGYGPPSVRLALVEYFDGRSWTATTPLTVGRSNLAVAVWADTLIATGGFNNGPLRSVEVFNGTHWREGPPLPMERYSHSAVVFGV
ncbi:uncharacterized protein MONBRDRAFT_9838 [Monosiga brevicollis MX1]|uniref:Uncharacterized protein n=1 Tax=Monosiga brevicollis TaxID=81824 RepID=A9V4D8_MONBE|nr:uncharacterized protein MONBRDRAFT_9838 [Monosiga brevicollis MX1]EDQ87692.1 predicted protein [Monosiga brevicollis MX1]|eukprot:XP_001747612.1 hypothetical protein [Monosiga brevicollis MX1]